MRTNVGQDLGHPRVHMRTTDSTNSRARELAATSAPHGTLVTAAQQTAGRGRQGRTWSAPAGSALLCSLLLRDPPPLLSLIAGVAVCDVAGEHTRVKWPNDVVVESHRYEDKPVGASPSPAAMPASTLAKLAGILVEGRPQEGWAVLGIGLNVAVNIDELPPDVRGRAASMGLGPAAIEPTLGRLIEALERRLGEPVETVLDAWRARDALLGRKISWAQSSGRAQGIDEHGGLIVARQDGSRVTLDAGEVHLGSMLDSMSE